MFAYLESLLISLSNTLSLEVFVFVASVVEEIIAPIPSPTVMMVSGGFASMQGYGVMGLVILALIGAVGKTLGALGVYSIAYYAEGLVIHRFGRFFGVTEEDISALRVRVGGGLRGCVTLTLFRALPVIPSTVVSVGVGVLKMPVWMVIVSTFFGTIVRDSIYLYAGYVGTQVLVTYVEGSAHVESFLQYAVLLLCAGGAGYLYYRHKKSVNR